MPNLIAFVYPDMVSATLVTEKLGELNKKYQITVDDVRVSVKSRESKFYMFELCSLLMCRDRAGDVFGYLARELVNAPPCPPLAAAPGATLPGARSGGGINRWFINNLNQAMPPGTSALFILVQQAPVESVVEELANYGGNVLHTSIDYQDSLKFETLVDDANLMVPPV